MKKVLVAYIPALHKGYRQLFDRHRNVTFCGVLGADVIAQFPQLKKDIRALAPEDACAALLGLGVFRRVQVLSLSALRQLGFEKPTIVMPNEDISRDLEREYFSECAVLYEPFFLRWDKQRTLSASPIAQEHIITPDEFIKHVFALARTEAEKSWDWWRQVGAVIVKNGTVLFSGHNQHVPSPHAPYIHGDPRANLHKRIFTELSTALHAEARLVAQAARRGVSLEGTDLFVTTFPCPPCARMIAYSGIKRCFYEEGYSMLDGEELLRSEGIEVFRVAK